MYIILKGYVVDCGAYMYIHRHVHVPVDTEALVFLDVCMSFFCESCRSNCYCSEIKT